MMEYAAVDRYFCSVMELIPSVRYFPIEPEVNYIQTMNKKYHKGVKVLENESKETSKRLKFNPKFHLTNEKQQKNEKEKEIIREMNENDEELTGLDGLRKRLAKKLEIMRQKRHSLKEYKKINQDGNEKINIKDKGEKKRKGSGNQEKSIQKKAKVIKLNENVLENGNTMEKKTISTSQDVIAISYGSLLVGEEKKEEKKTRNGRGLANIQNLLKKAEAKKARMEELKKTEEGRVIVQAKGWEKALKQAQGEKIMDDPKLLRSKLKKKLKQKDKSSKEWKQRVTSEKKQMKDRAKTKATNARAGKKTLRSKAAEMRAQKIAASKPSTKGNRAGFEGKKGEGFLNAKK